MKTAIRRITTRALCVAILTTGAFAQVADPAAANVHANSAAQEARAARFREGMAAAADHAKRGDTTAAEQVLLTLVERKPNTAQWHLSAAQHLLHLAGDLAHANQPKASAALIRSVLRELQQADATPTATTQTRATAAALTGFVQERYLGDVASAKASYRIALGLNPSAAQAKEALARLGDTEVAQ